MSIVIQIACDFEHPSTDLLENWAQVARHNVSSNDDREILVRIVDQEEMIELNTRYRQKQDTTNLLSFPMDMPDIPADNAGDTLPTPLGDIVICAPVVLAEANIQNKTVDAHWCHMVVHGVLHLYGLDHTEDADATTMEILEIKILAKLGYPDPYLIS